MWNINDIMKGAKTAGNAIHLLTDLYNERHKIHNELKDLIHNGKNPETISRRIGDISSLINDFSKHFHRH
jgi:hypothetical protein